MLIKLGNNKDSFEEEIYKLSGIDVNKCYQCGKCSAGCSVGEFVQDSPTRVIRLIQLNQKDAVMNSRTPYICASCSICSERCPMDIDIPKLMETIRILAKKNNIKPAVRSVDNFTRSFLSSVKSNGKLFEFGMTMKFNLTNLTPFKNAELGPVMLQKGKLSFIPRKSKTENTKKIFNNVRFFIKNGKKD